MLCALLGLHSQSNPGFTWQHGFCIVFLPAARFLSPSCVRPSSNGVCNDCLGEVVFTYFLLVFVSTLSYFRIRMDAMQEGTKTTESRQIEIAKVKAFIANR